MSIVTKVGDKGTTKLFSGKTVSKTDPRLIAVGTLDELTSCLGLARSLSDNKTLVDDIYDLQKELSRLGTWLSSEKAELSPKDVDRLEEKIVALEKQVNLPKSFIIPGTSPVEASLNLARTICRRLEREIVLLKECNLLENENLLVYCNRLSDYLFLLSWRG